MAEDFLQLAQNGVEVEQGDINLLGSVGGLADDHVLAELLRLAPFSGTVAKAVLPFGHTQSAAPTVAPNGASGSVVVSPFRVIVGSRDTTANIGVRANWNDLRSGICAGATLPLAAQSGAQA